MDNEYPEDHQTRARWKERELKKTLENPAGGKEQNPEATWRK
jgi:hypothetical protein